MEKSFERVESIEMFENFKRSLALLIEKDKELFSMNIRKETISARLALHLEKVVSPDLFVDVSVNGADILVWDRKDDIELALFLSRDYLSEKAKEKARTFHIATRPLLTLAFSLFEEKDYILVYRFEKLFLDYIHINPSFGYEDRLLKRILIDDEKKEEAELFKIKRRRRKKEEEALPL